MLSLLLPRASAVEASGRRRDLGGSVIKLVFFFAVSTASSPPSISRPAVVARERWGMDLKLKMLSKNGAVWCSQAAMLRYLRRSPSGSCLLPATFGLEEGHAELVWLLCPSFFNRLRRPLFSLPAASHVDVSPSGSSTPTAMAGGELAADCRDLIVFFANLQGATCKVEGPYCIFSSFLVLSVRCTHHSG